MEQAENLNSLEHQQPPQPSKYKPYKVDKDQAFLMALKGHTYREIAAEYNVSVSAISQLLAKARNDIVAWNAYKNDVDTLYEFKAVQAALALTQSKLKNASARDNAMISGICLDKARLIRGQATSISVTATLELTEQVYKDLVAAKYPETVDLMIGDQQAQTPETIAAQGKAALPAVSGNGLGDGQPAKRARAAKPSKAGKAPASKSRKP